MFGDFGFCDSFIDSGSIVLLSWEHNSFRHWVTGLCFNWNLSENFRTVFGDEVVIVYWHETIDDMKDRMVVNVNGTDIHIIYIYTHHYIYQLLLLYTYPSYTFYRSLHSSLLQRRWFGQQEGGFVCGNQSIILLQNHIKDCDKWQPGRHIKKGLGLWTMTPVI